MNDAKDVFKGGYLTDTSVGIGASGADGVETHGVYHACATGPVEMLRGLYVWLRDIHEQRQHSQQYLFFSWLQYVIAGFFLGLIPTESKWRDNCINVVTTVGKNEMLDKALAGSAYTAAWYMGLISATSFASVPVIGDTMASHSTWAEDQHYSQASRPTAAWNGAAAGAKALSAALAFSITATTTIKGCFINSVATKGGTTGVLFSAGLFTGGDKALSDGDTLNVSYTATLT